MDIVLKALYFRDLENFSSKHQRRKHKEEKTTFTSQNPPSLQNLSQAYGDYMSKNNYSRFFLLSNLPFFSSHSEMTLIVAFSICSTEVYRGKRHQHNKASPRNKYLLWH